MATAPSAAVGEPARPAPGTRSQRSAPHPTPAIDASERPAPRGLLSTRGVVLAAGGLSAAAAAAMLGEPDLLQLGLFVALLPLLSLAWTLLVTERRLRDLRVSREAEPTQVSSGTPVTIRLALEHAHSAPPRRRGPVRLLGGAFSTVLAEDLLPLGVSRLTAPPRLLLAGSQQRSEVAYTIVPLRRGTIVLGPTRVRPSSPLGLCDRRVELAPTTEITVTPRVVPLPPATAWREPRTVGDHRPRRPGSAPTEDASIRPYRRGDDLRLVHWRSSARRGELQVREGVDLRTPRSLVILDTSGRPGRALDAFEVAVDVAGSVGAHLLELEHDLDISLLDDAAAQRCRSRPELLRRLAEADVRDGGSGGDPAAQTAGRGDVIVLCTHVGSALAQAATAEGDPGSPASAVLGSLPPVAGRNPALALVSVPPGHDHGAVAPLTEALHARGWVVRTVPSVSALPDTWVEDTSRTIVVAGAGR